MDRIQKEVSSEEVKKQVINGNLLSPLPVVLVGALVNGRPNYLVIGYIAPFNFGKHIFFSLYKKRYTRIGIHENRTFSVNIPTEDLLYDRGLMGEGCIDIRQIRNRVENTGFDGFHEVEIFSTRYWTQNQHTFLQSIIKAYLQYS